MKSKRNGETAGEKEHTKTGTFWNSMWRCVARNGEWKLGEMVLTATEEDGIVCKVK